MQARFPSQANRTRRRRERTAPAAPDRIHRYLSRRQHAPRLFLRAQRSTTQAVMAERTSSAQRRTPQPTRRRAPEAVCTRRIAVAKRPTVARAPPVAPARAGSARGGAAFQARTHRGARHAAPMGGAAPARRASPFPATSAPQAKRAPGHPVSPTATVRADTARCVAVPNACTLICALRPFYAHRSRVS
jgi:hypothetical protein